MFSKIKKSLYQFVKALARRTVVPVASRRIEKKIRDGKDPDTMVFLSYFGIGDLLYCLSFLKEIKRVNPGKKIAVVTLEKYRNIVESFDAYDRTEYIPNCGGGGNIFLWFQLRSLKAHLVHARELFDDGIIIEPFSVLALTDNILEKKIDYMTAKRGLFGLSDDAPIQYHALKSAPVKSIPDFESNCARTVVLNPYSNSATLSAAGEAFFEEVCRLLKSRAYTVYTNAVKDQRPVAGSLVLRCSLEEMLGIAERIPLVVSLRSGLLDLLVPTGVNMFVIYNRLWHYIPANMKGWNCPGKVREIYYEEKPEDTERLMTEFKRYLDELGM